MKIEGAIAGDMIYHGSKLYGETGTRMAKVTLAVKVEEDTAKDKFGADFHRVAFGGMVVKKDLVSFACAVITKPNLTLEMHEVDICGSKVKVAIEMPKITPVENEQAVIISLVLPIEVTALRKDFFGQLSLESGDVVECEFQPIQMQLPGTDGMTLKRKDGAFGNPQPVKT